MYRIGLAQAGTAPHHITQCTPCLRHERSSRAMNRVVPKHAFALPALPFITRSQLPKALLPPNHPCMCRHACPLLPPALLRLLPGRPSLQAARCTACPMIRALQSLHLAVPPSCMPGYVLQGPFHTSWRTCSVTPLSSAGMRSGCLDMQCDQQAPSRTRLDADPPEQSACGMLLQEAPRVRHAPWQYPL